MWLFNDVIYPCKLELPSIEQAFAALVASSSPLIAHTLLSAV
jgi:hypothetical protein